MFSLFRKKAIDYFSPQEKEKILTAVKEAEKATSGEVRVFVENHCRFVDAIDRAAEIFFGLKMEQTANRNATLVYVALKDRQLAVFADEGIYKKAGREFWNNEVRIMLSHFSDEKYADGIVSVVTNIGKVLQDFFPYDAQTDKNELPDDIVFGK